MFSRVPSKCCNLSTIWVQNLQVAATQQEERERREREDEKDFSVFCVPFGNVNGF